MSAAAERRLLQIIVAIACLVPLSAGSMGVIEGPRWLAGAHDPSRDLESHFRYLSGIFLGVGIAFCTCVPAIERKGARFRMLGAFVVLGGAARLLALIETGVPSGGQIFGLAMELGVVPLLLLWQARVAGRSGIPQN